MAFYNSSPVVHYDNNRGNGEVCCGATDLRGLGPTRGRRTTDPAQVTCKRCLKSMPARAEGEPAVTGLASATSTSTTAVSTPHRIGRKTFYVERSRTEYRGAAGQLVGLSVSQAFRLLDGRGEELAAGVGDEELQVILGFFRDSA